VTDDILDNFMQLGVKTHWIVAMDSGDQIGALAEVGGVFLTPLDPFVVLIAQLHA
jgi:hypothetical protein